MIGNSSGYRAGIGISRDPSEAGVQGRTREPSDSPPQHTGVLQYLLWAKSEDKSPRRPRERNIQVFKGCDVFWIKNNNRIEFEPL